VGLKVESRLVLESLKLPAAHLCLLLASNGNPIFAILIAQKLLTLRAQLGLQQGSG